MEFELKFAMISIKQPRFRAITYKHIHIFVRHANHSLAFFLDFRLFGKSLETSFEMQCNVSLCLL